MSVSTDKLVPDIISLYLSTNAWRVWCFTFPCFYVSIFLVGQKMCSTVESYFLPTNECPMSVLLCKFNLISRCVVINIATTTLLLRSPTYSNVNWVFGHLVEPWLIWAVKSCFVAHRFARTHRFIFCKAIFPCTYHTLLPRQHATSSQTSS